MTAPAMHERSTSDVEWTQQRRDLWTGRQGGVPVGTIEHGRRYVFVDVDGVAGRGCRTLAAAQESSRSGDPLGRGRGLIGAFVAGASAAAATVGALLAITAPHLR